MESNQSSIPPSSKGLEHVSILVLANKQDKIGAHSAEALRMELGISKLLRNQKRMLTTFQCTVTDPETVFEAVNWAVIACSTAAAAAAASMASNHGLSASSTCGGTAGGSGAGGGGSGNSAIRV